MQLIADILKFLNDVLVLIFAWVTQLLTGLFRAFLPDFWANSLVWLITMVIGIVVLIALLGAAAIIFIYFERRGVARVQDRWGPNRCGPWGLIQPLADTVKLITKEDIIPNRADKWVFQLAPAVVMIPAVAVFAIMPFGFAEGRPMIFSDLNVGVLYAVAIASINIIGVLMAGWASNNKYSMLAAMRSAAMMVSYEIPMVLVILSIALITGSLSTVAIVKSQPFSDYIPFIGFILVQPLGFILFLISAVLEVNRSPLDFAAAESEIIAGYHIEYSGMRFATFYVAEYFNTFFVACMAATLFFGGWRGPILPSYVWLLIKAFAIFLVLVWLLGTLPRPRIDQMLGFAWKVMIPLALLNLFATAAGVSVWQAYFGGK